MIELGKFTPYYLFSTIFPGIFNAGIIYLTIKWVAVVPAGMQFTRWEGVFFILFSIFMTLTVGMRLEEFIFSIVRPKELNMSYNKSLANWREKLLRQINETKELKSRQLIAYVEKLMSEYYFLNNVIPGIIVSAIIILICFDCSKGWLFVVVSRFITVGITFGLLWLISWIMGKWLDELHSLQSNGI